MNITRRVFVFALLLFLTTTLATQAAIAAAAQSPGDGSSAAALFTRGRLYVQMVGTVQTGGTFANTRNEAATVSYFFTDASGNNSPAGAFIIPANGQIVKFFNEAPFSGAPSNGTLTFMSTAPLSVSGLKGFYNEAGQFLLLTTPVSLLPSLASETVTIPHWADGAGWTARAVIMNNTNRTVGGTAQFLGGNGTPATLTINGVTGTSFPYTIPPRSSIELVSAGTSETIQAGSVRLVPAAAESSQSGFATISFKAGGVTQLETSIPGSR